MPFISLTSCLGHTSGSVPDCIAPGGACCAVPLLKGRSSTFQVLVFMAAMNNTSRCFAWHQRYYHNAVRIALLRFPAANDYNDI